MAKEFYTVARKAEKEIIIKKSRFIAYVAPTATEKDAEEFIAEIKKKHKDATHNVSAFIVGREKQVQRANDDGEPNGTAGKPVLEVLKNKELTDVTVVVTRYFGGIKLGAGGLIRAYGKSAIEGIEAAGEVVRKLFRLVAIKMDYSMFGAVQRTVEDLDLPIDGIDYTDKVTMKVLVPEDDSDNFIKRMIDFTNDNAIIEKEDTRYLNFSRN